MKEDLLFGDELDGDIIYEQNGTDKKLEHDWVVVLSRFLYERHRQKDLLMSKKIAEKCITIPKNDENYCEKINYNLNFDENLDVLTQSEFLAYQSVRDEVEALAQSGFEKAIAFYLQHTEPHGQDENIRNFAEKIAQKQYKTAEEWEISASLKFFEDFSDSFFEFNATSIKTLCDMKRIAWNLAFYYARDKFVEEDEFYLDKFQQFASQIYHSDAYQDFVKSNVAYFGRAFNSSFASVSDLDDCLFAVSESNYNFLNEKMLNQLFGDSIEWDETLKAKALRNNDSIYENLLKQSLRSKLKLDSNRKAESEDKKIPIKEISTYLFKQIKDFLTCDDTQIKEKFAEARYLAYYQGDVKLVERGFTELSAIGTRPYHSDVLKSFNKVPKFLEEFQNLFPAKEQSFEKEDLKV